MRGRLINLIDERAQKLIKHVSAPFKSSIKTVGTTGLATTRPGEGSGGTGEKKVLLSFGLTSPSVNAECIEFPIGNQTVVAGFGSLPSTTGGYILLPSPTPTTSGAAVIASNNQVRAWRFLIPYPITVSRIAYRMRAGAASAFASVAIYDNAGTTRLLTTGAQDASNSNLDMNIDVTDGVLNPGYHWLAWTSSDSTVTLEGETINTSVASLLNLTTSQLIVAGNASSGGACPTTLGTLTTAATGNPPVVKLQA